MKSIFRIAVTIATAVLMCHPPSASAAQNSCSPSKTISTFISDVFYQNPQSLVESLRGTSFNTVATTVAWSVIEKQQGHIDISMYYPQLDALSKAGYCLILLIDTSGRMMRSDVAKILVKDVNTIPLTSQPDWIASVAPKAKSVDFYGDPASPLDFQDKDSLNLVTRLYKNILPKLRARYEHDILAVSPCVTTECEVKYSQTGFRWQSYAPQSQQAFRTQLSRSGIQPADMPVMNYGNHLANGNPRIEPLYPDMQKFREDSLRDYVCALTREIRRNSMLSIGYFGQTFAFPDGIYATGVIEKTANCFDIAAIDYNFYNGYGVEFKPEIPAFLTDYALAIGYKKVLVGMYMERFRDPVTYKVDPRGYDILRNSLDRIEPNPRIAGVEIGNLTGEEFRPLSYVSKQIDRVTAQPMERGRQKRVAVYASVANSYLWEGEWSNNRQIIQDDLLATYSELKSMHAINVSILTDEQLRVDPKSILQYDLIVLPHVTAMPTTSRTALGNYYAAGGRLLADMRADEYFADGRPNPSSQLRKILGIGAAQAFSSPLIVSTHGTRRTFSRQPQYVDGFLLAPLPGYSIAMPRVGGHGEGLLLIGPKSTVFGFMPLLVKGDSSEWARLLFRSEVERLVKLKRGA